MDGGADENIRREAASLLIHVGLAERISSVCVEKKQTLSILVSLQLLIQNSLAAVQYTTSQFEPNLNIHETKLKHQIVLISQTLPLLL